jgi:hypothetical protein
LGLRKKIEISKLGYLSSITQTDNQQKIKMATKALQMRVEELEALTVILTKKIEELEAKPVTKIEASADKKVRATGLKKDGTPRKKRAPCGYMLFSNEKRAEVRDELLAEADGEKVPPGAVVKKLAEMWNDLGDEEKEPYNTQAKEMAEDEE